MIDEDPDTEADAVYVIMDEKGLALNNRDSFISMNKGCPTDDMPRYY